MTRDEAFLHDILAHPDDDAARLIYADFLQEGDDPARRARGEFIRVQCELARPGVGAARRAALRQTERELLARHERAWLGPLAGVVQQATFDRGFVTGVRVEARRFLEAYDELFRLAPVRHLSIYWGWAVPHDRHRWAQRFAECPPLARVEALDLTHNHLGSSGVEALAVSPHLTALRRLDLSYNRLGDRGVRALLTAPFFARLEELALSHNDIGPTGARLLAEHCHRRWGGEGRPPALRRLLLGGNRFGAAGWRAVAASPALERVAER